ncbi:LANO_0H12530g1_1 [Lachancea nothofagi CBS 11611]|uniref:LANO_0H12530g1_1 n=1 Tax=Lachancea nothofagi CBS 11611 TaxID=1266666 RepID=A0A1G4KMC0_9SACH|nr:LANO_0H12530g1_1 [Lachancea nothofagi CBS 11611]
MSLEEFFNDNSLGDSVWNEEDINLEAISSPLTNTTSIDVLKHTPIRLATRGSEEPYGNSPGATQGGFPGSAQAQGPPYIVKFAHLPSQFTGPEIEDLFQTKCTKFIKFKLFWELNKKPSVGAALKNSSFFDLNFTRDSKVAFTELYSARDMDKILNNWTEPLRELYDIVVTPADFADFKHYIEKTKQLNEADDPAKPFTPKKTSTKSQSDNLKSKSNPFGSAKPTDTQSITNDIEDKFNKLHVEDTKTLRRLSSEGQVKPDMGTFEAKPKPLSYSAILKRSVDAAAAPPPVPQVLTPILREAETNEDAVDDSDAQTNKDDIKEDENLDEQGQNSEGFTFRDSNHRGYSGSRGRGSGRGGRGGRGDRSDRGGRGDYGDRGSYRGRGTGRGGYPRDGESGRKYDESRPRGGKFQGSRDENPYSVFRPASGFLRESVNSTGSRGGRGGRGHSSGGDRGYSSGGDRGRGGHRGDHRGDRRGFTAV